MGVLIYGVSSGTVGDCSAVVSVKNVFESIFGSEFTPDSIEYREGEISWVPADGEPQPKVIDVSQESVTINGLDSTKKYTFSFIGIDPDGNRYESRNITPYVIVKKQTAQDLIDNGYDALEQGDIDSAVAAFKAAYIAEKSNETRMYAALAQLAAISVNSDVVDLMRNRLGFIKYPEKLNALINQEEWWSYQEERYDFVYMPDLADAPAWLKASAGFSPFTLWMALLVDNNTTGLNNLIDDVLTGAFGTGYTEASDLIDEMTKDPVTIDKRLIKLLNLTEAVGEDTIKITKAELKTVTAVLDMVKGTFQFLQAYNLDTPLNFLKFDWDTGSDFELGEYDPAIDPCENGFLDQRSGYTTKTARDTYVQALSDLISAYDSLITSKNYPAAAIDFLKKYEGYKTLAQDIQTAIQNIGINNATWVDIPYIQGSPATDGGADFRVNLAALKDGYFKLEKLIDMENKKPVFKTEGGQEVTDDIIQSGVWFGPELTLDKFLENTYQIGEADGAASFGSWVMSMCCNETPATMELYYFYYPKSSGSN